MIRNILLIEPNYKNKYPPLGLMKIASYHRILGDNVVFFKGELKDLFKISLTYSCIRKLANISQVIDWESYFTVLMSFISTGCADSKVSILELDPNNRVLIDVTISAYRKSAISGKITEDFYWDRIYISTLFTFFWKITIETINFTKKLIQNSTDIKVGGVAATVLAEDIESETGVKPICGLLDKPGVFDDNNIIIDTLTPDYSILEEIDYKYPAGDAFFSYTTRGCIRNCSFCAVKKIEPKFNPYVSISNSIKEIRERYGDKQHLLLLDNNVLASNNLKDIVAELVSLGFYSGATYVDDNKLEIAIKNIKSGFNKKVYINTSLEIYKKLLHKLTGEQQDIVYEALKTNTLLQNVFPSQEQILAAYEIIGPIYEKKRYKGKRARYIDFNQGLDARLMTDEKVALLAQLSIRPLRIAFDSMEYEEIYTKAVRLAAKHGLKHFSNYLLYNEKDKPVELYQRLKINVDLCSELGVNIYSFPMKYHPITGKDRFNRDYLGEHWNRKYVRAIQTILNATKGKIGVGKSFFEKAFGSNEEEFHRLLIMPELYILLRFFFEKTGLTQEWENDLKALNSEEKELVLQKVYTNHISPSDIFTLPLPLKKVLRHYTLNRDHVLMDKNKNYYLLDAAKRILNLQF